MHTNHVVFVYQEHVIWCGAKHKGAAVQLAYKPPVQHHTSSRKATVLMNEYSSTCYPLYQSSEQLAASEDWNLGYGLSQSTQLNVSQCSLPPADSNYEVPCPPVIIEPQPQFSITKVWCEESQEWFWPYEHEVLCTCRPQHKRMCLSLTCHQQRVHVSNCQLQHPRSPHVNYWLLIYNKIQ